MALPGVQSDRLNSSVTPDIKEDIQEAERANYSQCYKACVAMCRRALQLSLIDKGIEDKPLSQMLNDALNAKLLTQDTYNLSTSIKGYGDIAVHRREIIEPEELNYKKGDFSAFLNDLQARLHDVDMALKQYKARNEMLIKNSGGGREAQPFDTEID